jgi:protoporphyrinogen IX oxidase
MSFLVWYYPWIKAFHVIGVIAWMAGLLYLPRLFAYHCEVAAGSAEDRRFQTMERRLLRLIMNPALIATYILGGILLGIPGVVMWSLGWIYVKLAGVAVLTVLHHAMGKWRKAFVAGKNRHSARFYRLMNEVPTAAMVAIVIMVIVKPF